MKNQGCKPQLLGRVRLGVARALLLLVCVVIGSILPFTSATVQCLGQKGEPVDWFIVYKLPIMPHEKETPFKDGHAMFYMDANNPSWTLSPNSIDEKGHAIFYTLQQLYEAKENSLLYLMFNDEKPDGSKSDYHGHAKGSLAFDGQSGFWLIHSAPKFPPEKKRGYSWMERASRNGQSFLCMSFDYHSLGVLAKQWLFYYPNVYDHYLPPNTLSDFPLLADLVNSTRISGPPYFSVRSDLSSLGGLPLISFAKFTDFGKDVYDALVAPTLRTSLLVETWQDGPKADVLPSNCSASYQVFNVIQVTLPGDKHFKETKDHSKYVLSLSDPGYVCVGGINRVTTQFKRAGGTLCFHNKDAWSSFHNIVTFFQPCART